MNDWLSEIEHWTEEPTEDRIWRKRAVRMARVIREYAPIVKCADIYSCAGEETTFEECSKALILMAELLNNLSDDAKELVRST